MPTLGIYMTFTKLKWHGWGSAKATASGYVYGEPNMAPRTKTIPETFFVSDPISYHGVRYYCKFTIPKLSGFLGSETGFRYGVALTYYPQKPGCPI